MDYEKIQNMADNDSLDETAGEISSKDRTAMSTRMKRWQGAKIREDHYPEEISYEKRKSPSRILSCHSLRDEKNWIGLPG